MKPITLQEAARACGGRLFAPGKENLTFTSVYTDSRRIEQGSLFVPIQGARVDGHDFIPEVMEKGAAATLSEKQLEGDIPYILVEHTEAALAAIAKYYRQVLNVKVVGITGSVGKTSTKEMVASVLSQRFRVLKTDGNYNNEIGLPLTIFRLEEEDEIAVLEMGIDNFGQMNFLADIARPDVAVITNIGYCHLEFLGDRDGVYRAKTEIFDYMTGDESIILNGMDDKLAAAGEVKGILPFFFGLNRPEYRNHFDVYADHLESRGLFGTSCEIHTGAGDFSVTVPIPGDHMVLNAAAATAVGLKFGMELSDIKAGIERAETINGRLKQIKTEKYLVIDDCYNANPVSMKAALDVLSTANTRRVAILGDMFELGEKEKEMHAEVGAHAARCGIDLLLCAGRLCANMKDAALKVNPNFFVVWFAGKKELMEALSTYLKEEDTILIKASNGMGYREIVNILSE